MSVSKTTDYIQIQIKMSNSSQEPQESSKAPNEDLMDMDVFCTLNIKIEICNQNMGASKTRDQIQTKIQMQHPSQEPSASSKAPNDDLKDMDVLCTFKIKIESQNLDHGCIKDL